MKQLVDDLLEYSRVTGRDIRLQPTDSASALRGAISHLKTTIEESKAEITHDDLPTVMADRAQLQRGRIWVESGAGKGSSFLFMLPAETTGH